MSSVASERRLHLYYYTALKLSTIYTFVKEHRETQSSACTTQGKPFAKNNLEKKHRD